MPMGIVSDSDFLKERENLSSFNPAKKKEQRQSPPTIIESPNENPKGRGQGNVEVPDSIRKLIGDDSVINGRQSALELAKNLGISASAVSAYSTGATSTATYDQKPNQKVINGAKTRVQIRARRKLMLALNKLTDDKLDEAKARDLAGIAKDMSVVMKNMEDSNTSNETTNNNGPTFVIFTPQIRREEQFDVVDVRE